MRNLILAVLLLVAPAHADAQQVGAGVAGVEASAGLLAEILRVSAPPTGDDAADARIARAILRVERANLSSASLTERVRLGRARGVAAQRIATAVDRRADAMLEAHTSLRLSGDVPGATVLELSTDAIESGAHGSQVSAVAHAFAGRERTRALAILGALAAEGRLGLDVVASIRGALAATGTALPRASSDDAAGAGSVANRGGVHAHAARWIGVEMRAVPR